MASWQDGAEYAPTERPDGFATPRVAVLPEAPPLIDPAAHQPLEPPHIFEQRTPTVPLEALVPALGPTRDPHQAFTSTSAISTGAWGAAHADGVHAAAAWTPDAPLVTSAGRDQGNRLPLGPPSGRPVGATTFAPPQGPPVLPASGPGQGQPAHPLAPPAGSSGTQIIVAVVKALGWPLVAVLLLGGTARPLAFVMLGIAALLANRSKVAVKRLNQFAWTAVPAALILGLTFTDGTTGTLDSLNRVAQILCWVLVGAFLWTGYRALTERRK